MTTYAVRWREPDGQTFIGRLCSRFSWAHLPAHHDSVGADGLAVARQFAYEELLGPAQRKPAAPAGLDGTAGVHRRADLTAAISSPAPVWELRSSRSSSSGWLIFELGRAAEDVRLTRQTGVLRPG